MLYMARDMYMPAIISFASDLATGVATKAEIGIDAKAEKALVAKLTAGVDAIAAGIDDLEAKNAAAQAKEDPQAVDDEYRDTVIPAMETLRAAVDSMEVIVSTDYWPVPNYNSMLFWV